MNQTTKKPPFDPKDFLSKANGGRRLSEYVAGRTIFHQGDPAVSIFYILTGSVKLTVTSENGKDAVVAILGSDEFFGERCADGETVRLSTASALTEWYDHGNSQSRVHEDSSQRTGICRVLYFSPFDS